MISKFKKIYVAINLSCSCDIWRRQNVAKKEIDGKLETINSSRSNLCDCSIRCSTI